MKFLNRITQVSFENLKIQAALITFISLIVPLFAFGQFGGSYGSLRTAPKVDTSKAKKSCGMQLSSGSLKTQVYSPHEDGYLVVKAKPAYAGQVQSLAVFLGSHTDVENRLGCEAAMLPLWQLDGLVVAPVKKGFLYTISTVMYAKNSGPKNGGVNDLEFYPATKALPAQYKSAFFVSTAIVVPRPDLNLTGIYVQIRPPAKGSVPKELEVKYSYTVYKGNVIVGKSDSSSFTLPIQSVPGDWSIVVERSYMDQGIFKRPVNNRRVLVYPRVFEN